MIDYWKMSKYSNPYETIEYVDRGSRGVIAEYCRNDVIQYYPPIYFQIKNVIFNEPATIVFWNDGTKTVVKAGEGEPYDKEKGLAMAIAKKFFGNKGSYYYNFKKWL